MLLTKIASFHIGAALPTSLGYAFSVTCHAKPAAEYAGRGWKGRSPAGTNTSEVCTTAHREAQLSDRLPGLQSASTGQSLDMLIQPKYKQKVLSVTSHAQCQPTFYHANLLPYTAAQKSQLAPDLSTLNRLTHQCQLACTGKDGQSGSPAGKEPLGICFRAPSADSQGCRCPGQT